MRSGDLLKKGNLQINRGNVVMNKFMRGDIVYVIDAKGNYTRFVIQKFIFNAYTDGTYKKVSLLDTKNTPSAIISSDSIFKTSDDACKFALVYLVKRKEPTVKINTEMSALEQYQELAESYPELILKYMNHIANL